MSVFSFYSLFGLMELTHGTYEAAPDEEEAFAILDRAHELENRFWNSAE